MIEFLDKLQQLGPDLLQQYRDSSSISMLEAMLLTIASYQLGLWCYQKSGRMLLLHPVLLGGSLIAACLYYFEVSYQDYQDGSQIFYFLLGPATVALAVPLYQEFKLIRELAGPILITVVVGAVVAAGSSVLLAYWFGASESILLSLAPKSVTTPIALSLAEKINGISTLTTGAVVFTGVIGALLSPWVFKLCRVQDDRLKGIVLGINAHGIGTALAFENSPRSGAFSSLAMGLTGAFTAMTLPYIVRYLY